MAVDDTLRAIRLSQIVFLLVDAETPLEKQDLQIADLVIREGRILVLQLTNGTWSKTVRKTPTKSKAFLKIRSPRFPIFHALHSLP